MKVIRRDGRRTRLGAAAPLTTLALCAASLVLTAPAHADTGQKTAAGTAKPRVIGGDPLVPDATTWLVSFWRYDEYSGQNYLTCNGALVAANKVLTSASCAPHLGDETSAEAHGGGYSEIRSVWVDPSYKAGAVTDDNDVAVVTLASPITFSRHSLTLPVATVNDTALYAPGTKATAFGWGNTTAEPDAEQNYVPLSVTLPVNSDATCAAATNAIDGNPLTYVPGHMFCAGTPGTGDDTTGKTTCLLDEGGPVVAGGKLIGLVSPLRDPSSSKTCNYPGTYPVFSKVTTFSPLLQQQINDTDATGDGKADILARTPAGESYLYESTGTGYKPRVPAPVSLTNYDTVVQSDLDSDGYQDYILRAAGSGNVFTAQRTEDSAAYTYTNFGLNWKAVKAILAPGDVTGDGRTDLISEDSAGRVSVYAGKPQGQFNKPVVTTLNWSRYNLVIGHGDFNGDGLTDAIARDAASGDLYLLTGTGALDTPFQAPVLISSGWNGYDKLVTVGDYNGDGHPDLLARTPSGALFLYKGTGNSGPNTFTSSVKIGTGWNMYNLLG